MTVHAPSLAIGAAIAAVAIIGVFYVMEETTSEAVFTTSNIEQSEAEREQETLRQESPQAITMSVLYDNGSPYLGNPNAPITIVEFGDYQCFFCNKFFHDTEGRIYDNYIKTGKAKMIFKDFTIIGQDSVTAAHAAHCAGEQGLFWEYHDALYNNWDGENNGWASEANQYKFAQEVGLDETSFKECMESGKFYSLIETSSDDARTLGLTGTPGFFIVGENGRIVRVPGAQPYEVFVDVFESPELRGN